MSFKGAQIFHYYNGSRLLTESISIMNYQTVHMLVPLLLKTFIPQQDVSSLESNSCILLVDGGSKFVCVYMCVFLTSHCVGICDLH